jgi:tetratricopeptide (TPR) repeat protein
LITVALANANRAHTEYLRATATKDFLLNIFDAANPERHEGRDITARELLVLAEENIDSYISNNASLRTEILSSMIMLAVKVGDLESAKRMLKERSSAYIVLGEEELSLISTLEEAHFSLLDGDFEKLKFLVDRAKYLSRKIDVSDTEKFDIYLYEAWVDFDSQDYFGAINKFKVSKSFSNGDVLRSVAADRGIANSFYRSGNPKRAVDFLNKSIEDLDKYKSDHPEKYFRKIEVLSDLYAIGEYKNGWKFAKPIISDEGFLNISNGYDLTKFYEIWVTWFLRVEGLEKLLEWANTNKENLKKIDAPATRLLWRVVEGQHTPRYGLLEEVEAFSEVENVLSLEYLVFESELKIRIPSYSESAKLESDQRWGFSDARSKAYQLYFSAVHELSQGRFEIAANKFDSAYSAAIGVFGRDHPETMRVLLGKVATSYESRGILPDRELLSAIGDVLEGSYGGQSGEVRTVRWWLSEWGKSPSPREILEKLRMTLYG